MNARMFGNPYRTTTTIPSSRTHRPHPQKKPSSQNTSFSFHQTQQTKIQMNNQVIEQRRENHLNSQFNRRKIELKHITRENKKIHERINSQKSLYSQQKMNKSTDSLRSLSRCSSRSKSSQKGIYKNNKIRKTPAIAIEPKNINQVEKSNIQQFKGIFSSNQQNYRHIGNHNKQIRMINKSMPMRKTSNKLEMGGMLHRIAEQIIVNNNNKRVGKKIVS